jgi:TRAP-type C4-dicarboxylate transport system substrate-binding protein
MKKALILGLVLVLALAMGLAACGGEEETTTTAAAPATTATTAAPVTTATTAAPETTTTTVAAQEPITLKYASTFQETESGGKIIQHFCDYVEDKTAGAVKFDIYFGGTLGNNMEELGLVSSGSVDMISFGHPPYADQVPLLNFPMWAPPDAQTAVDYFNFLVFENPDTSALIQAEAAANNIIYLGFTSGGGNVFISKEPFTKLSDLVGKKFGAGGSIPAFEALGYTIVQTFPPDTYENLSRGVIDATQMGFVPTVNLKWYEVAKYYMWDGTYAAGNAFSVNLDTWAKLTPETQQIFRDAAKDTEAFSLELDAKDTEANLKVLADAGVTVGTLSPEDQALWWKNLFDASAVDCMTRAEKLGITDNMITVLKAAAEFTKVEWTPPAK